MPLLQDISANIAGLEPPSPSRKRTHADFIAMAEDKTVPTGISARLSTDTTCDLFVNSPAADVSPPSQQSPEIIAAPPTDDSPADGASQVANSTTTTTTTTILPKPPAPTGGEPPSKRKKLTAAEKEEKAKADEIRKQEKAKADELRKQEKAKADEIRKEKAEEREKKRLEKEKKDEERERKRQEKENEQRKAAEAKEKKERSQLKLASFFKAGPSTPSKAAQATKPNGADHASPSGSPQKQTTATSTADPSAEYRRVFKPFFVKEHVKLAGNAFELDEPARLAKSRTLDEFISGERQFEPALFTSTTASLDYFYLPTVPPPRGRPYPSVKKIMNILSDSSSLATESGAAQAKSARELLQEVPMKYLRFFEDVRPAYHGTITTLPPQPSDGETTSPRSRLRKLARQPSSRDVLPLQYDYDSEAEWVDDGDGEDIDGDDEDDEDMEEDEDMTDFLDDSEDSLVKRPVFASGMEPESSGLCFEDHKRCLAQGDMAKFRMEFIIELDRNQSIDPFSSHYWEPDPKVMATPAASLHPSSAASMSQRPKATSSTATAAQSSAGSSTNAFAALSATAAPKKAVTVPAELLDDFKRAILRYPKLSKVGLVEVLSTEFERCTKAQVKNFVEALAERTGTGHDKAWRLKAEHAM